MAQAAFGTRDSLERNIVVGDLGCLRVGFLRSALVHAAVGCGPAAASAATRAFATLATAQHDEVVHNDFSLIFLLARFFVVPRASAQRAFDVNGAALFQIFAGDLGGASKGGKVMPLGVVLPCAFFVLLALAGGQAEFRHRHAAG